MKKVTFLAVILIITLSLMLASCNVLPLLTGNDVSEIPVEDQAKTLVAQTMAAIQQTQVPQVQEPPAAQETPLPPTPTETLMPTNTPEPTLTPTNTMTATPDIPRVNVSVDTNCRTGPSTKFDWVGALLVGETAELVGRSSEGDYWIIKTPDAGGNCWLWGQYATVSGQTAALPLYTPPPTPTPLIEWAGTWSVWYGPIAGPQNPGTMIVTTSGENFSGSMVVPSGTVYLVGVMLDERTTIKGNWNISTSTGKFEFIFLGSNQFQGNYFSNMNPSLVLAWCGAKGGASQPSLCYKE